MLKKVLCVEDSRIMQKIYKRILDEVDFSEEVIPAYNGKEAIDYYYILANSEAAGEFCYPELIFLDLNMPVMDGWEFLNEFEKLFFEKNQLRKVVVLTSSINPQEKERAMQYSSVMDYLPKPLSFENLHELKAKMDREKSDVS